MCKNLLVDNFEAERFHCAFTLYILILGPCLDFRILCRLVVDYHRWINGYCLLFGLPGVQAFIQDWLVDSDVEKGTGTRL